MEKKAAINTEGSDRSFENLCAAVSEHEDQLTGIDRKNIYDVIRCYEQLNANEGRVAAAQAEKFAVYAAQTKLLPSLRSLSDKLKLKESDAVMNIIYHASRGKRFGDTRKFQCSIQEIIAKLREANEAATAVGNIDAGETADNIVTCAAIGTGLESENFNKNTSPDGDRLNESLIQCIETYLAHNLKKLQRC